MRSIDETRSNRARVFSALGIALLCGCDVDVPRGATEAPAAFVPEPDTRPRTFVARGDVVDGETVDASTPVRAMVRFHWVDRGRLESCMTWSDDSGRFELWSWPGQHLPPDTRGTLFASTLNRPAFASLLDVPVGGEDRRLLAGKGDAGRTCGILVRDAEGALLEHGEIEVWLVEPRPMILPSFPGPRLKGSVVELGAPSLPIALVVKASHFLRTTLGPFDANELPESLVVDLQPVPAQAVGAPPRREPLVVGDVVGHITPPRDIPAKRLVLDVKGLGKRGVARDGSFSLPDLPAGTHVVQIAECRHGIVERAHVRGREWDTSIVCDLFGTDDWQSTLRARGFIVDVDATADAPREIDLRRLPAYRIEGRITLDSASSAASEAVTPIIAELQHIPSGTTICDAVVDADGRFVIGLDEPREVELLIKNSAERFYWRLRERITLQREPIAWTRHLATGSIDLEPAWVAGELCPPAEIVVWRGAGELEVSVYSWEEEPVTRRRRFDGVPAGSVVLFGNRPVRGRRVPVGAAYVTPGHVTLLPRDH